MKITVIITQLSPDIHKARCPALPGCIVLGRSRQEAAERISSAVTGYLASFDAAVPGNVELEIREHELDLGKAACDRRPGAAASLRSVV